jgi:hypothetical protein
MTLNSSEERLRRASEPLGFNNFWVPSKGGKEGKRQRSRAIKNMCKNAV